jgi:hypothetical protein
MNMRITATTALEYHSSSWYMDDAAHHTEMVCSTHFYEEWSICGGKEHGNNSSSLSPSLSFSHSPEPKIVLMIWSWAERNLFRFVQRRLLPRCSKPVFHWISSPENISWYFVGHYRVTTPESRTFSNFISNMLFCFYAKKPEQPLRTSCCSNT